MSDKNIDLANLEEVVIKINRVAKVLSGRRRFLFTALVAVGDKQGHVGLGYGKGKEVPLAIQKAILHAKNSVFSVSLNNNTIPHEVLEKFKSSTIMLKPATEGTGLIAGATARAILELAGVRDILTKSFGSNNPNNLSYAVIKALKGLRSLEDIAKSRGKSSVKELFV